MLAHRRALATAWLEVDPDARTAAATREHLDDDGWLAEHFGDALRFGTAGLRAPMGPGPARMNRVIVRLAARAVARVLDAQGLADAGVVVGFDARFGSREMAADAARVLAAMSVAATLIDEPVPTPVVAYLALERRCGAALVLTASHNPSADNGLKVYWADGTQIRPPLDTAIEAQFNLASLSGPAGHSLVTDADLAPINHVTMLEARFAVASYVGAAISPLAQEAGAQADAQARSQAPASSEFRIAYTAMFGVGAATISAAFAVAGLAQPVWVESQCEPDPTFGGMEFPNPEEPGALDEAIGVAQRHGVALVLANDPDADRLAVAAHARGEWHLLTGDQIGLLLCDHLCARRAGSAPGLYRDSSRDLLAASSVVSGSAVEALCRSRGVVHVRTLTGFKWVMEARIAHPDADWVFGYEEALGYSVGDAVMDKDGVSAAVEFARLAQRLAARGATVVDRLDELAGEIGAFETANVSVRASGADAMAQQARQIAALATSPPTHVGRFAVSSVVDWNQQQPPMQTNLVELRLDDDERSAGSRTARRVAARPSGTEPKMKLYLEVAAPGRQADPAAARAACRAELDELRGAALELLNAEPKWRA